MPDRLSSEQYAFVKYLTSLNKERDRGPLAVMRRGASGNPVQDLNLYRFVTRKVPDSDRGTAREAVYYLVSALYALHPLDTDTGNFGDHLRRAAQMRSDSDAAERRFSALLSARLEDLHAPLRQAVMMIRQIEPPIPINWAALFADLLRWEHPNKLSQREWANHFWGYERPEEAKPEETANQPIEE